MDSTPITTSLTADQQNRQGHTRTYQACLQCRSRKVKCDLGAVDDPGDPPCRRCRREGKECTFSKTRRKRKGDGEEGLDSAEPEEVGFSAFNSESARKRQRGDSGSLTPSEQGHKGFNNGVFGNSSSPRSTGTMSRPLRRPDVKRPIVNEEEDQKLNENTAAILQRTEILGGHDAMNLLYEATLRNGDIKQDSADQLSTAGRKISSATNIASPQPLRANGTLRTPDMSANQKQDNAVVERGSPTCTIQDRNEAIEAWSRFRFIRAGWFTPSEAIEYIDYFYKFLSPLSPITVPDFQHPKTHPKLLADEPMLTVTILTIASRYVKFQGPGGISRPYAIHSSLWNFLQGMIDRMIWGQEQFGGGFCGAGSRSGQGDGTRKGLRTLGSIESLLLLVEWHTRALHFPPGEDNDELMLPDPESRRMATGLNSSRGTPVPNLESRPPHSSSSRIESWLEPCWRSDRMSWSLLANAMALAFEMEIFTPESERSQSISRSSDTETIRIVTRRRANIKKLLFIYMELTSGRLGLKSMLHDRDPALYVGPNPLGLEGIKGSDEELNDLLKSSDFHDVVRLKELQQDVVLYFWCRIAVIFQWGNMTLFPSIAHTKELIKSGRYAELLIQARTKLLKWKSEFDQCKKFVPEHLYHILLIEYEYSRVYVNIIALQAVVERCINSTPGKNFADMASNEKTKANNAIQVIPARALMRFYGNDRIHISETTVACRNLLAAIVQGLRPGDYLKHAPVRTYFRIIAVSMVLLKTFVVGTSIDDAAQSFTYMQQASEALEHCVVDDVHVGNHIGAMLGTLTTRVKSHLIRVQSQGDSSRDSRASSQSPAVGISNSSHSQQMPSMGQDAIQRQYAVTAQPQTNFGQYSTLSPFYAQPSQYQAAQQDLYDIQSNIYDPNNPQTMIMPPPWSTMSPGSSMDADGNVISPHGLSNQADLGFPSNTAFPDWVGLPLAPLVTSLQGEVGQNGYGPDIGGDDMLEPWLLHDDFVRQYEPNLV